MCNSDVFPQDKFLGQRAFATHCQMPYRKLYPFTLSSAEYLATLILTGKDHFFTTFDSFIRRHNKTVVQFILFSISEDDLFFFPFVFWPYKLLLMSQDFSPDIFVLFILN